MKEEFDGMSRPYSYDWDAEPEPRLIDSLSSNAPICVSTESSEQIHATVASCAINVTSVAFDSTSQTAHDVYQGCVQSLRTYSYDWDAEPEPRTNERVREEPRSIEPGIGAMASQSINQPAALCEIAEDFGRPATNDNWPQQRTSTVHGGCPNSSAPIEFPNAALLEHFPAIFSRSGIFRVGRGKSGEAFDQDLVRAQRGHCALSFEGTRLNLRDKRAFEATIKCGKETGLIGQEFRVSLSALSRAIGGSGVGGRGLQATLKSLRRLCQSQINFDIPNGIRGSAKLLNSVRQDGRNCLVSIDPKLAPLFEHDKQFLIKLDRRNHLSGGLAQWLHDFLSTHQQYDKGYDLGYIRQLCGYERCPSHFPADLEAALAQLSSAVPELVQSFEIRGKVKRLNGDKWQVIVMRGTETPTFKAPTEKNGSANKWGKRAAKASRRGGVAL